jgi:hypothetical protein
MRALIAKLFWWKTEDEVLRDPVRLAAQAMTLGTWDDVLLIRRELGDSLLREALWRPPSGVFDARSWHYWHLLFGIDPVPPLPRRELP